MANALLLNKKAIIYNYTSNNNDLFGYKQLGVLLLAIIQPGGPAAGYFLKMYFIYRCSMYPTLK